MRKMRIYTLNSKANLANKFTRAWMADDRGNAIEIYAHMQAGENPEDQVDEYAFYMLNQYCQKVPDEQIKSALQIAVTDMIFGDIYEAYEEGDELDPAIQGAQSDELNLAAYVEYLVEPENKQAVLDNLMVLGPTPRLSDILRYYEKNLASGQADKAIRYLHMRLDRTFMRVRVGGLKNHEAAGTHEINFRIPDTEPTAWYRAISNFLADHTTYIGYELNIYSELKADATYLLESFADGKEFMDLKASRRQYTNVQNHKLNSAYRREQFRKTGKLS